MKSLLTIIIILGAVAPCLAADYAVLPLSQEAHERFKPVQDYWFQRESIIIQLLPEQIKIAQEYDYRIIKQDQVRELDPGTIFTRDQEGTYFLLLSGKYIKIKSEGFQAFTIEVDHQKDWELAPDWTYSGAWSKFLIKLVGCGNFSYNSEQE